MMSRGQVAEWLKAAAHKNCYTTQVVPEVRILARHHLSLFPRSVGLSGPEAVI